MTHDREDRPTPAVTDPDHGPVVVDRAVDDVDDWELADLEAAEDLATGLRDVEVVVPDGAEIADAADRVRRAHSRADATVVWAVEAPDDLDDAELLHHLAARVMDLEVDADTEISAALEVLEPADWVGVVVGLVTTGVGAPADAATLADLADPDVDGDEPLHPDDRELLERSLDAARRVLEVARAIEPTDAGPRLTRLGAWLLSSAAASVWPSPAPDRAGSVTGATDATDATPARSGAVGTLARIEGRVFTHRLSPLEGDDRALRVDADLAALAAAAPLVGATGTSVVTEERSDGTWLVGPDGWLPTPAAPGALIALRVDHGCLEVVLLDDAALDAAAGELAAGHLREVVDAAGPDVAALDLDEFLLTMLDRFPASLRRPVAPVGELLASVGLQVDGGRVVAAAAPVAGVADDAVLDLVARHHGLDVQATRALHTVGRLAARVAAEDPDELPSDDAREGLRALTDLPTVPVAFADASIGIVGTGADLLERLVALLRPAVRGRGSAALELLVSRAAEARGDASAAESALRRVLQADPDITAAHADLAWYLELRGDARGALGHLRLAGVPDDDVVVRRLEAWTARTATVGRNDPCPCGSGAKYKRCCERTGGQLHDRAGWLIDKIVSYARLPLQRPVLLPLVEARAGDATDGRRLIAAMRDPLVLDAALFDHGLLRRFLADRGMLLPADERELVARWLDAPRSLYEVVAVDRRAGARVRDLREGRDIDLSAGGGPGPLAVGELTLGRLLFDGRDHTLAPGAIPVEPFQRDGLLHLLDAAPPGVAVCAWAAAQEAATDVSDPTKAGTGEGGSSGDRVRDPAWRATLRLRTIDGEPLAPGTVEYRVADPARAVAGLRRRFEAEPRGTLFVDAADLDGRSWSRATLTLDGDRLLVTSTADSRFERVAAILDEVIADAQQVAVSRCDAAQLAIAVDGDLGTLATDRA